MTLACRSLAPLVAVAVVGAWLAPGGRADESAAVVARVGVTTITAAQVEAALRRGNGASLPAGQQRLQAEAAALEQLIDAALLEQVVANAAITADPAAVEAEVAKLQKQITGRGGTFAAFLAQTGQDEATFRGQVALEVAVRQLVAQRLTPQAVAGYFEKHRREIDGTLVRVSHVVLRPDLGRGEAAVKECLARAAAIRGRILQGETTFAEAARAHSAGPSRRRGGDMGYLPRRSLAHEEFAKQAFALAKGDISQPFVTPFGVHLVQVTDVQPGERTFVSLRPQIEQLMTQQIVRDALAAARREAPVEIMPGVPHFDPATPADGSQPRRVIVSEAAAQP
jgi:parvulin-like peptidyl-prolyl isomerase